MDNTESSHEQIYQLPGTLDVEVQQCVMWLAIASVTRFTVIQLQVRESYSSIVSFTDMPVWPDDHDKYRCKTVTDERA